MKNCRNVILLSALILSLAGCTTSYQSCPVSDDLMAKHPDSETLKTDFSERIDSVLVQANGNKPELTKVLNHYADQDDCLKYKAAEFLIGNMRTHCYARIFNVDSLGNKVPYNSLVYEDFDKALEAWDALEAKYPNMKREVEKVWDAEAITSDYLIRNIDMAFSVWKSRSWASDVSFDTFCNYLLPYRGSNEPINPWRQRCIDGAKPSLDTVQDLTNIMAIKKALAKTKNSWVKFKSKVYLHPTDQGFEEMIESKVGRCEDISNMLIFINRANGLPTTSDYTPAWAKGNNNHAWEVILDGNGKLINTRNYKAAKIYRKMYAEQQDLPYFNKKEDEVLPGYLNKATYLDVTDEYIKNTTTVTIPITEEIPSTCSWAYLSVFNSGRWVPIVAGRIDSIAKQVTFPSVGGDIMYRPVFCVPDENDRAKQITAAPIIIVEKDQTIRTLNTKVEENGFTIPVTIIQTRDVQINADTGKPEKTLQIEPDKEYELFYFDKDWVSLGKKTSTHASLTYDNLPPERLYRLKYPKGRGYERPFTVDKGKTVLW